MASAARYIMVTLSEMSTQKPWQVEIGVMMTTLSMSCLGDIQMDIASRHLSIPVLSIGERFELDINLDSPAYQRQVEPGG